MLLSTSLPPERFSAQTINDDDDDDERERGRQNLDRVGGGGDRDDSHMTSVAHLCALRGTLNAITKKAISIVSGERGWVT